MSSSSASLQGTGSLVASGLLFEATPAGIRFAKKYVGEQNVPQDIKRRRRQVYDIMRHMGAPVLVKHMYNAIDVENGIAKTSPVYDEVYGQTRNRDPVSHGIGFVSVEESEEEWLSPEGEIKFSASGSPGSGWVPAPKYRGYGPGYLIYMIQPDAAEDLFRVDSGGVFIKVQSATAQAPWYPEINDNDLVINCQIDRSGNIIDTLERFESKQSSPVSMRGFGDRYGRREYTEDGGNRYVINQTFEMSLLPDNSEYYRVETDR
jgi:hypothetical protein